MDWQRLDLIGSVVEHFATAAAIVFAGIWAFWRFIIRRENEPAANIDVDVEFVGIQDQKWIIQITATLANKSLVRLHYKEFVVAGRYVVADDPIVDGDANLLYQLEFEKSISQHLPDKKKREFGNASYINPNQEFRHRYVTSLPVGATFFWVRCKFHFQLLWRKEMMNTQKIVRVPDRAPGGRAPSEGSRRTVLPLTPRAGDRT